METIPQKIKVISMNFIASFIGSGINGNLLIQERSHSQQQLDRFFYRKWN